jgi:hypothetical protein
VDTETEAGTEEKAEESVDRGPDFSPAEELPVPGAEEVALPISDEPGAAL